MHDVYGSTLQTAWIHIPFTFLPRQCSTHWTGNDFLIWLNIPENSNLWWWKYVTIQTINYIMAEWGIIIHLTMYQCEQSQKSSLYTGNLTFTLYETHRSQNVLLFWETRSLIYRFGKVIVCYKKEHTKETLIDGSNFQITSQKLCRGSHIINFLFESLK